MGTNRASTPEISCADLTRWTGEGPFHEGLSVKSHVGDGAVGVLISEATPDGAFKRVVKIPHTSDDNSCHKSMLHEIKVYNMLKAHPHPFVLSALGQNKEKCAVYLPYMENGDLANYIRTHHEVSSDQRVRWCYQTVSAVGHLHSFGVLHGDLHPGNLLVDSDLNVKLGDFEGASLGGCDFEVASLGDTARCMGPQWTIKPFCRQLALTAHDLRQADTYSIGSTFYAIETGKAPYEELKKDDDFLLLYEQEIFPHTFGLRLGDLVRDIWVGKVMDLEEIRLRTLAAIPLPP